MPAVQYAALSSISQILSSVPEGLEVARLVKAELESAVSDRRVAAEREEERLRSDFYDASASRHFRPSLQQIDKLSPSLITALQTVLPVLEAAMQAPSFDGETLQAFKKLQRISSLTGTSQTMPRVLDPSTLDRARDLALPRVESPALRYLERMIRSTEGGNGRTMPVFTWEGSVVHRRQLPEVLRLLGEHFGSPVTQESLEELFRLPQKDYRFGVVAVRTIESGKLRLAGEIFQGKQKAGYFAMLMSPVPPRGTPWSVKVEAISLVKTRQGLGSQLLARVAHFLHDRGVHTMTADAMEDAGLFCVFNGFRLGKSLYEEIVAEFLQETAAQGIELSTDQIHRLLDPDSNLAELAAFEWKGERIGRDFLQGLFTRKYLPVKFELSADEQSWLRLLSNLHRNDANATVLPLEWEGLNASSIRLLMDGVAFAGGNVARFMSSDKDHASHLVERLNNWAQPLSMFMEFPSSLLQKMSEDRRRAIDEQRLAAQDVVRMIAADPSSPLFSHFRDMMDPGYEEASQDNHAKRGFLIARTLLTAEGKGLMEIPDVLRSFFKELVSRTYANS